MNTFDYRRFNSGNLFFPHRIARMEYFLRNLGLTIIAGLIKIIVEKSDNLVALWIGVIFLIAWAVMSLWVSVIPRLRDLRWNTKIAWLMFIPGVNLILGVLLMFTPGK